MNDIHFGTDGWRAVIADTFTFGNLRLVAQAFADDLRQQHPDRGDLAVVVGYDTRFLSDRFAAQVAAVLAANDITTWLTRTDAPTPVISYNVKARGAQAGIIITASHNPPRYNGFKVKNAQGGSAAASEVQRIEAQLKANAAAGRAPQVMDLDEAMRRERVIRFDPSWVYYQHLTENLIDLDQISERELNVVADAMWGSGRGAFSAILARTRSRVTDIRSELNPGFGGIHPEPILRHLNALLAAVQQGQADVGLATDGDADRIGAIDGQGNFVDPHHIFALVLRHLVEVKGQRGDVVKTVSTTTMIDKLAESYGLTLYETPVGFNHIADLMGQHDVLIGGEESGGIGVRGHIPEGDGVLMGLLLLEVMAQTRAPLHAIIADLQAQYGPAHYARIDAKLSVQRPKAEVMAALVDGAPGVLNGESVQEVNQRDGVKFILADRSWLLVRPSGTEPVLRVYAEAPTPDAVQALLDAGSAMGKRVTG